MKMNKTVAMDCRRIEKLAWGYMEANLPSREHELIESHLAECASCKEVYQETKLIIQLIEKQKSEGPSPFLASRILSRLEGKNLPKWEISFLLRPAWSFAVASIIIAIGIFTGSIVSNNILAIEGPSNTTNTEMLYANQSFIMEADYYIPGFEYLNE